MLVENSKTRWRGLAHISYSSKAPGDIPAGSNYAGVITKAIKKAKCLALLTDQSQNSIRVDKEVERALSYGKTIIPIALGKRKESNSFLIKFLKYKDFAVCDESDNDIMLCHLPFLLILNHRDSRNVLSILIWMKRGMSCTTPVSVRSTRSMNQ